MKYTLYEVGGKVRDEIMGLQSKDVDYSVVVDAGTDDPEAAFFWFVGRIGNEGYQTFLTSPEVFTVRAKFPKDHEFNGLVADFVMARYEEGFSDGTRRPSTCRVGTLEDDLRRRDFTINAVAKDIDGNLIDPFGGVADILTKTLRCPVSAEQSFNDDPLRMLRALRFKITKGMRMNIDVISGIRSLSPERFEQTVSIERIREELEKMFKFDTKKTLSAINDLRIWNEPVYNFITESMWFKPTVEKK